MQLVADSQLLGNDQWLALVANISKEKHEHKN
jgi:hypothetical protein